MSLSIQIISGLCSVGRRTHSTEWCVIITCRVKCLCLFVAESQVTSSSAAAAASAAASSSADSTVFSAAESAVIELRSRTTSSSSAGRDVYNWIIDREELSDVETIYSVQVSSVVNKLCVCWWWDRTKENRWSISTVCCVFLVVLLLVR